MTDNCKCDRCGSMQEIPRGYGFADGKNGIKDKGYNLCRFCAERWEELISNKRGKINWRNDKWRSYANKLLKNFVFGCTPKKLFF